MKIYNNAGIEILDIQVDDKSYLYKALQEIDTLTLYFQSVNFVEVPVGSYCLFLGETYTLQDPENFKKHGERKYEYTLVLESSWSRAKRYKVRNLVDDRLKFDLTAKPVDHLQLIVDNMNERDPGWTAGACLDSAERVISYNHIYCKDALQMIAETFKTEIEIVGKEIRLGKVEYNKATPLALSYGQGNGFVPGVGRINFNNYKPVDILYIQGGSRNIDFSKYGSRELLLPKSQQLVYEGKTYESDANGLFIKRADKVVQDPNEDSIDCSHIYPSRVGTISSVEVIDADKHFYDIIDISIPADLDYSLFRTAGEKISIIFQSGMLAGREFDIEQTDNTITGYVHSERRFKLVPQDLDGQTMPNAVFIPSVGDKYAVFGISLPDAYVCDNVSKTGASWDMFLEAAKYLYSNEDFKFSFTGELDGIWAKQNWITVGGKIKVGGYVSFSDTQFQPEGLLIRIIGVKQYINNPYSPEIELSNSPAGGLLSGELRKIGSSEVINESRAINTMRYTNRRVRDIKLGLSNIMEVKNEGTEDEYIEFFMTLASLGDVIASIEGGGDTGITYDSFKTWKLAADAGFTWGSNDVVAAGTIDIIKFVAGSNISIQTDAALKAIKISATGGGGGTWGSITGSISNQTDLQNALNLKAPLANPIFTGTVQGITKAMVGLGSVDNTADANKTVAISKKIVADYAEWDFTWGSHGTSPMSISIWDNYTQPGAPSGYGTLVDFTGLSQHEQDQLYFAQGSIRHRYGWYGNNNWSAWRSLVFSDNPIFSDGVRISGVGSTLKFDSTGSDSSHTLGVTNDYWFTLLNSRGAGSRIDLTHNSGLKITYNAFEALKITDKAIQFGAGSFVDPNPSYKLFHAGAASILYRDGYDSYLAGNSYYTASGWLNKYTGYKAGIMGMVDGSFEWSTGTGTTAGASSGMSIKMILTNAGNLLVAGDVIAAYE